MSPARQGPFRARYKSYRCPKCGSFIEKGHAAYRVGSQVYCMECGRTRDKSRPGRTEPPAAKPARKVRARRKAPSDPTAGGGAMPGENCAARCADGVWRYEFASASEACTFSFSTL